MNTNAIRDVATRARRQLMEAVERRCLLYGIEEGARADADTINGRVLSATERAQRRELLRAQEELRSDGKPGVGHAALVEQAAYTWFNRLFAIRFMELNDRLPSHVRMLSAQDGSFAPECLREAMDLPLDELDRDEAARLVAEGDDEGLFRLVLLAQCAELAECMSAVFERVGAAMELLLPDGLLAKDGVVESLVTGIPEEDWQEGVEIVGWAYQFYVSERKDEFFKSKRKAGRDDIAPATQLFTPEYIVRFLVQNSLGRLWVLNNPSSPLAGEMEYFVKPDPDSHEDFRKISSPEEITLIDPACGSGHFLCYAFDLLARMYEERGYRGRDIARLILEKNLTGVEIDRRAASLTSFALTMKACELDGRFMRRSVAPKVLGIKSIVLTPEEREEVAVGSEYHSLLDSLAHLDTAGSLWRPTTDDIAVLKRWAEETADKDGLFSSSVRDKLSLALTYAELLGSIFMICATNPPYMGSRNLAEWLSLWTKEKYPEEKGDLCTCFIRRGFAFTESGGYNAMVTMQSWMFQKSYEMMRTWLISHSSTIALAHLGSHAFEAISGEVVKAVATVLMNGVANSDGIAIRVTELDDAHSKEDAIKGAVRSAASHHHVSYERIRRMPGYRFIYWAGDGATSSLSALPTLDTIAEVKQGMVTRDNDRFLRLWWEVPYNEFSDSFAPNSSDNSRWVPVTKGGANRKWYGNNETVVDWKDDGRAIIEYSGSHIKNRSYYFHEGLTWTVTGTKELAMRFTPAGFAFEHKGSMCFSRSQGTLLPMMGYLNSSTATALIEMISPATDFGEGAMSTLPYQELTVQDEETVSHIVENAVAMAWSDYDSQETSWGFTSHPLLSGNRLSSAFGLWSAECKGRFDTLRANEEQLNAIFARIYHMEGEVPIEVPEDKVSVRRADLARDVKSLISYAVGCMFGRYSLDKPGLVLANQGDGLPEYLAQVPHPRYLPDGDGILPITDDEYFEDDIVAMFCEFLKAAYGAETLEENLQFVADALGGTGSARRVIRTYFMNQFFKDHCATYSVPSAGKRPIYWLVDSGRLGGFRALVYMHRYTPDLLARVRTDYVHERQERYRSRIAELEREREGASRREQSAIDKELKRLRAQLDEVTKFEERLHHLADQMIEIDLDDGFKVNYAKFSDVMAKVR
ncbi:MAG: BREX-1 system adenine-specific DNA-methyltransferase PglX [Atopobiaceae bacterium]|nr:BREX-1 system adenine-specific DNA-methyltransferase PglX [Atopobiaceae bacterium]